MFTYICSLWIVYIYPSIYPSIHLYTYIIILIYTYTYICVLINTYMCMNRYMRIDACMFNDYFFFMDVGFGVSFQCEFKVSEWNESFFGNVWGPPNLSSSCNNNSTYVKYVSLKNVIFGRYKMIKKPLRTHAKSLSDALAPSKKKLPAALASGGSARLQHIWNAHCLPDFGQKGWRW